MKVLLIYPPPFHAITPRFKTCLQEGLGFLPPYGLLSIAAQIKAETASEVQICDCLAERLDYSGLEARIRGFGPDIAGISALTHTLPDALQTAGLVTQLDPAIKVVLGGPHTQIFPRESAAYPNLDYLILGEGEIPFTALIENLSRGEKPEGIPGVIDLEHRDPDDDYQPFCTPDLNRLTPPDRSLLPPERYFTVVSTHPPTTVAISSRGCPHSCIFCHTAGGKSWRGVEPEYLLREIKAARQLGIKEFFFFDENFLHSRARAIKIAELLIKEKLDIYFDFRTRADTVDLELLQLMKKAGAQRVQFGLESGSPAILKSLHKGFTIEQAAQAALWARKAGLITYASFMLGLPGEKAEQIRETIAFALSLPLDLADCSIAMPLPETKMYQMARDKGLIPGDPWREFALNPKPDFVIPYWEENFSRAELETWLGKFFRHFYLRPAYLLKSLRNLTGFGELKRKLQAAIKVLGRI